MPSARKSAPPKSKAIAKRSAVPHGPSEGKGKPAASKAPAKAKTAPAKTTTAARTTRGGAAASARPTADLTPLQERFVFEYLKDFNGSRAYRVASPGCTPGTATANAARTLAMANVRAAVDAQRERAAARMELTTERVLLETARLAFFDPRALFDVKGNPLPVTELDDHTAAAVAGLEVLEQYEGSGDERHLIGHLKKYKIADKNSALERAAKFMGMFEKDNRQKADPLLALLDGMRRSAVPVVATPPQDDDAG